MPELPSPPSPWEKLRTALHASTRIFEVVRATFRHPHRPGEKDFFVITAPDWVNVIALTPAHHLVLVRQFRFGTEKLSDEIPGGMIDAGEDPIAAGVRELREETGYVGVRARLLGAVHPNPAIQNNRCHFVLVEEARPAADLDWDPDEEIEVMTRPVAQVYALAQRGEITHALVLDALLLFAPVWAKMHRGAV